MAADAEEEEEEAGEVVADGKLNTTLHWRTLEGNKFVRRFESSVYLARLGLFSIPIDNFLFSRTSLFFFNYS